MRTRILVTLIVGVAANVTQAATFTWLGDLPGGTSFSAATAVSANGQVVVGQSNSANGKEAFRYQNGVMTGLGDLAGHTPYESRATTVSGDGSVIAGISGDNGGLYTPQAFIWTNGVLTALGYLPTDFNLYSSSAFGISDDGSVVVGESTASNGLEAAAYHDGAWHDLGTYPTFDDSSATAIAPAADVIAGQAYTDGVYGPAFLIQGNVITPIGDLPGGEVSAWPTDVSTNGAVVVGSSLTYDYATEAFRYADGMMTGLGFLPGGNDSYAHGVSSDGSVVVGESDIVTPDCACIDAFIWTAAQGMQRISDVLATQHPAGFDRWWFLQGANGVSADGLTIVGYGKRTFSGPTEAWLAVLDSATAADSDDDGVIDGADNCTLVANPNQLDTDFDRYGNICDADLNDSGLVTAADFNLMRSCFNQPSTASALCAAADMNGSGTVTAADFNLLRARLNAAPGPSGWLP